MKTLTHVAIYTIAALALSSPSALADERGHSHAKGNVHDHGKKEDDNHGAMHGGKYVEDDAHHGVEMVVKETAVIFHVTEHHAPLDLAGSNFKVVLLTDAGTKMLTITIEGSTIKADLDAPLPHGAKIVLSGKDGHGDTIQARFVHE